VEKKIWDNKEISIMWFLMVDKLS